MTTPEAKKIRVLVIDDSPFMRKALTRMLSSDPAIEVVGKAGDGGLGLQLFEELTPDVVTLDVKMPKIDGIETLKRIMALRPTPVLMLSSYTQEGSETTLKALELGAIDFIDKSSVSSMMDILGIKSMLLQKVKALAGANTSRLVQEASEEAPAPAKKTDAELESADQAPIATPLVIIGTSTGGPNALQAVITKLPADLQAAVLVIQHIPKGFTSSLASRLDRASAIRVREGFDGAMLNPGTVWIAPAGIHAKVVVDGSGARIKLSEQPSESLHRPSTDVTMESAAKALGKRCVGVILTGMGRDGEEGVVALKRAGGIVLAESEKTALIYGMPRAAVESGAVDRVILLDEVASAITELGSVLTKTITKK